MELKIFLVPSEIITQFRIIFISLTFFLSAYLCIDVSDNQEVMFVVELFVLFGWNNKKRDGCMLQNVSCNTAHDDIFQPFFAVRAHYNEICM
jgi:hypothetical protein